jgi:hypothetical protein
MINGKRDEKGGMRMVTSQIKGFSKKNIFPGEETEEQLTTANGIQISR